MRETTKRSKQGSKFVGFYSPRSTQVPDNFFDEVLRQLSGAEVKVLLYIFRRTFGFKRDADNISLSQMVDGIVRKDGRRLDGGTGLSKASVAAAVKKLVERGMVVKQRKRSRKRGDEATSYSPKLTFEQQRPEGTPVSKNQTRGGVQKSDSPVSKNQTHNKNGNHSGTSKTVNGGGSRMSLLRQLPDLKQPKSQTQFIVDELLSRYGDGHSTRHYQLVAAKVPYEVIQRAMSEIKNDGGARQPARVFTARMERYAARCMKSHIGEISR